MEGRGGIRSLFKLTSSQRLKNYVRDYLFFVRKRTKNKTKGKTKASISEGDD